MSSELLTETILLYIRLPNHLEVNEANFDNAIIESNDFICFLKQQNDIKNIPLKIKTKQDLRSRLERTEITNEYIDSYLKFSTLPEK